MKAILSVLVYVLCILGASANADLYGVEERYVHVPDGLGNLHLVDLHETNVDVQTKFNSYQDVTLYLYTRKNPNTPNVISNGNLKGFESSNLDVSKPVKFVIHGWNSDFTHVYNDIMRSAFLRVQDANVIFVDWSIGGTTDYISAAANVPKAGQFLGYVIDWLVLVNGVPLRNIHVVGHSLGGHVAGIASRSVTVGKVPYVSGLDPALPLWGSLSQRIRKTDGVYVEIIHSNAGIMGQVDSIGHNDFYPNGGSIQPGCDILDLRCSHWRAFELFADSLGNQGFTSQQCADVFRAETATCTGDFLTHMGGLTAKPELGIFYLTTNSNKPYSSR